ncbi:hypothetical protein [Streptomyces sp. NPDC059080]|uniref:hypothetical protein n=1 Tax=Streptomyces sp. NPDC059080 TaxID=3346718 RepID=UPI0036923CF4
MRHLTRVPDLRSPSPTVLEDDLACRRGDYDLTPALAAAALAVDAGPKADDYISTGWCCLDLGHTGPHYVVVRDLYGAGVWIRWLGPLADLVVHPDCPHGGCPLFARHTWPCPD